MRFAAIRTARNAALHASCAKRCVPRLRSPSSRNNARMARAARPATTSISPSASSADCARSRVPWTRSSRPESSSITARSAAISFTPSRCCSRSATASKRRSRATGPPTRLTDEETRGSAQLGEQGSRMSFQAFVFYVLAAVLVFAAIRVITARNPVHCALFLVLAFVSCSGLWLLLEAEFLAIVLVLVYVGAVMVLFLFVVMMLDINLARM